MPRMRDRGEQCPYCYGQRGVTVNLDEKLAVSARLPKCCLYGAKCIEELRDKALLAPFEEGKVRLR